VEKGNIFFVLCGVVKGSVMVGLVGWLPRELCGEYLVEFQSDWVEYVP